MPVYVPPLSRINDSISISGYTELYKLNLGPSKRNYACYNLECAEKYWTSRLLFEFFIGLNNN